MLERVIRAVRAMAHTPRVTAGSTMAMGPSPP